MRLTGSGYNLGYNQFAHSGRNNSIGLPVANKSLMYSYYKHVHGYSVSGNSGTVPISKIRILNSIIDNLSKIKQRSNIKETIPSFNDVGSDDVSQLIESYASELHQLLNPVSSGYSFSETGLIVSLSA